MLPKLNKKRALFVLTKIDEILAWEQRKEAERDTRFVELGRSGGTVLEGGEPQIVRRVPGATVFRVQAQGVLPYVHTRTLAPAGTERP
jgi:hypothetical protein